jgi:hypothetical protein
MRSATQLAVYETYEDLYGRKSTLDELIAEVGKFTQQSMLWVCAVIVTGMQLWNRIDAQPEGVFRTLVNLYFDRSLHARLIAGHWSSNPRRVLFHRRQILLIAKIAIKHCSGSGMDARMYAEVLGDIILKANDQFDYGLLADLSKMGRSPATRDEFSRVVTEMVAVGEDGSPHIAKMVTRSHLMLTRFANELRNHKDWIDVAGEYQNATGLTLDENEAMIFGAHARYGEDLSKLLYREPGVLPLKEANFATTAIKPERVSAFLDSLACTPCTMAQELRVRDNGPNDLTIFRKYPLVQQFYNLHLKTAWCGFLMMDNVFFLDKVLTGPYWHANATYGQRIHRFWGSVFEKYVNELMRRALAGTNSQYFPDPRTVNDPNVQICDGLVLAGDSLVLMEYKGSVFRADTKYGGDHVVLAAEIEKKFVHDHESKNKKGVVQLAEAVKTLFGRDGSSLFPQIDLKKIKRVYLYIVTLDSIGGTIGMSALLNTFLDEMLDRSAFPSIEIRPLFCSEIEALEDITGLFAKISLPQILETWFVSNPALMAPLQAVDFSGFGWMENEWLRAEWVAIYKNVVRVLFPNEDPDAVVAKETQFRKSSR